MAVLMRWAGLTAIYFVFSMTIVWFVFAFVSGNPAIFDWPVLVRICQLGLSVVITVGCLVGTVDIEDQRARQRTKALVDSEV